MEMMTSQNLKKLGRTGVTYPAFPCLGFWNTYPKKNGKCPLECLLTLHIGDRDAVLSGTPYTGRTISTLVHGP